MSVVNRQITNKVLWGESSPLSFLSPGFNGNLLMCHVAWDKK